MEVFFNIPYVMQPAILPVYCPKYPYAHLWLFTLFSVRLTVKLISHEMLLARLAIAIFMFAIWLC